MLPPVEGREIEIVEVDRFLQLVGVLTGQQYPGNVRLDQAELVDRMIERRLPQQFPD
jgi:hypothetical protein